LLQWLELAWRWRSRLLICGLAGVCLGMGVRLAFPGRYVAIEQLLFDPEGMKVFASDATPTRLDANAQINFVESQMGVLLSERVLSRLFARECNGKREPPPRSFAKFCGAADGPSARALEALRAALSVKRAERSFLVDVTAVAVTPAFAARLAADLVDSYIEEEGVTRAAAAAQLGAELEARIDAVRRNLAESEKRAEAYRRQEDLTTIGDRLLIELKLTDAANGLDAAQSRMELAEARMKQLETTPQDATGLGALGDDSETRPLSLLLERRAAARADLAPLAARMGARNPELIQARSRLDAVERDIAREIASIRAAAHEQLVRAEHERETFNRSVERLTSELNRARQSQIALQALDQSAAANRKLLENFESRSREVAEMGRLDLANLRIASQARPPPARNLALGLVVYGAGGFLLALAAALAAVAGIAALAVAFFPNQTAAVRYAPRNEQDAADLLHDASRRLRAGAVG
jgi:uncharacterized protein involved in exopolysaccharide biosynthesis